MCGLLGKIAAMLVLAGGITAHADESTGDAAASLNEQYSALRDKLKHNGFDKPLYLESTDKDGKLKAHVYAVLDQSYATVRSELQRPERWCDILILHPNTKYCRPQVEHAGTALNVAIGRKSAQQLEQSYRVHFAFDVQSVDEHHLGVFLQAGKGPFGTRDYRILLEAVPLPTGQTFIHFAYSYAYGTAAKLALLAYLNTKGSSKVGFTVTGRDENGQPAYIRGLRGLIERNVMRYYLAIDAHFGALSAPATARVDKRLNDYYAATESYARQLHESNRHDYVALKRKEHARQQLPL